ncbi:hypothetical protein [Streptomyces sp. NPDC055060]
MSTRPGQSTLASPSRAGRLLGPRPVAAGQDWDAIRVEAALGMLTLRLLRAAETAVGPVLHDRGSRRIYFLTPPGTTREWQREGTRALGSGSWVVLVPPGWHGTVQWVVGPYDGPAFTDPANLATALAAAEQSCPAAEASR